MYKKIPKPYDTASGLIIFKKSVLTRQTDLVCRF